MTAAAQASVSRGSGQERSSKGSGPTWDFLWGIGILAILGSILSIVYGKQYSIEGAILAFLASLLGYAVGGVSGFLFGFPRYTESVVIANAEDVRKALAQTGGAGTGGSKSHLQHNTNLERITDWLMTMVIGATLVNLKDLAGWSEIQFRLLTKAIASTGGTPIAMDTATNAAPGVLLVVPFMIAGFLHLYLWARRYLPGEWRAVDDDLNAVVERIESKQKAQEEKQLRQESVIGRLQSALYQVNPMALKRFQDTLIRFEFDQSVVEEVVSRYRNATSWRDDPVAGFGEATSEGFELSASVLRDDTNSANPYRVEVSLGRTDGVAFSAAVAVLLHNSFDVPFQVEPYNGAKYEDVFWCAEPFVLGAMVCVKDGESFRTVRLALDLEKLGTLPEGFVSGSNEEG